jgi:hypothetical protein
MKKILFLLLILISSNSFGQVSANQFNNSIQRKTQLVNKSNKISFSYVYKNGAAYGKSATVTYDDFYKTYYISFTKQNGSKTSCQLTDSNFTSVWKFKYNGNNYSLTNSKK